MQDGSIIDIILFAAVAAFIFYRLRATLGSRTGHEKPPHDPYAAPQDKRSASDDNVIPMPRREDSDDPELSTELRDPREELQKFAKNNDALLNSLTALVEKDSTFHPRTFLQGARSAYEMIVMSFAQGDKDSLRPMLSEDVFEPFAEVIDGRADRNEMVETQIIGVKKADLVDITMNNQIAEVTVKFVTDLISTTRNADNHVIEGDPNTVSEVTDVWTFARDTESTNPNWILIATESA